MALSAAGILILALTVLDALLTVLDASGRSIFSARTYRMFWWVWRHFARLLPRQMSQQALSMAAPLMIATMISLWIGGVVTGFALIFYGGMSFGEVITGGGSQPSLPAAFRLSWVTLSTIGFVEISPSNMAYSVAVALEALLGSVILTFSITYFLSVHRSVLEYDRLVADLSHRMLPGGDPIDTVAEHLASGDAEALERWLERLNEGLIGMHQGLSRYPIVYFYRPRWRERSLPRTLRTLGELADGLAHCLPGAFRTRPSPALRALMAGVRDLVSDLREAYVPTGEDHATAPLSRGEFDAIRHDTLRRGNPWVRRFFHTCDRLSEMTGGAIAEGEVYERYRRWLPAAQQTSRLVESVSRHLGYDEHLRPPRSSYFAALLARGPKQGPQSLRAKRASS